MSCIKDQTGGTKNRVCRGSMGTGEKGCGVAIESEGCRSKSRGRFFNRNCRLRSKWATFDRKEREDRISVSRLLGFPI